MKHNEFDLIVTNLRKLLAVRTWKEQHQWRLAIH